jgi:glycosyltransferase involved in cell wall biosynthesis
MSSDKKVLYITYDGMTDQLGQSQVIPYLQVLARQGYRITLLSTEKKDRLIQNKDLIEKILSGSGIQWETILFSTRPPFLSKMYDQWKLNRRVLSLYKREKFDFIHVRSYVPMSAAIKLYHRFRVPYLFDMRGFWVNERVDNGQWNLKNPVYRVLFKIYKKREKEYLKYAAHIITLTSRGKRELIETFKVPVEKISIIPCSADLEHFDYHKISDDQKKELKSELIINGKTKILSYLGSLGGWYLTDEMLDFFKKFKEKFSDSVFLFITHNNKEEIIRKAESKGINSNSIRVRPAARQEVPALLSISDWSIFFIKDAYSKRASSPTKQGEIMAMGIPIVCNDIGDTGRIIEESAAGVVVEGFNEKEYEKATNYLTESDRFNKELIRRSSFRYYDLQNAGKEYEKIYQVLASGH